MMTTTNPFLGKLMRDEDLSRAEALRLVGCHPGAGALDPLAAPGPGDLVGRPDHRPLRQGEVAHAQVPERQLASRRLEQGYELRQQFRDMRCRLCGNVALLPAGTQKVRLPIWSPVIDLDKLLTLAKYAKEFGVISTLPNFTQLVPSTVQSGKTLQGTVGPGRWSRSGWTASRARACRRAGTRSWSATTPRPTTSHPGARREQEHERAEDRPEHVDGHAQEGRLPGRLRRASVAEALAHGPLARLRGRPLRRRGAAPSAPDLLCGLDDQAQLRDLLLLGQGVALDSRREPALG